MNEDYETSVQQNQEEAKQRYDEEVAKMRAESEAGKDEMGF
ncbi:MAG: hypothetical protein QG639_923 [Patescibacteria group bacterium]|jgi:hypothetical protein|nr:hypothetical protein [Patescibacteria group bacterium]